MGGALIDRRPVGTTGLELSVIGFGSAPIGDIRRCPDAAQAEELLAAVWAAGIRYFDTAPFYGCGQAERRLGDFLRDKPRDQYVLSTKVGRIGAGRWSAMAVTPAPCRSGRCSTFPMTP